MFLNIPFFKQTTPLNCGPIALKMVLAYFNKNINTNLIEKECGLEENKGISTIEIANAASRLGLNCTIYSKHIYFNQENLKKEFYKKYATKKVIEESEKLIDKAKNLGIVLYEEQLNLDKILKKISKDNIAIILINWNIILNKEGYQGHFVPITGYDENNVYIHNHGLDNTKENMKVPKEIFDKARKSDGTDEDILFLYKK